MASERRHKSRPRRRRGRFGFAYKLLSVLLVIAAVVAACLVFFRINQVTVTGNARYTAEEIADVSGIRTGDNLIALSKSKIAARIRTRLPYVQSVSIRRALPDTVILTVTEHTAAAAVSDGANWWYISAQGKLLETVSSPGQIIQITGLTAVEPELGGKLTVSEEYENRLTYVLSLLSALDSRGMLADCTALDCSSAGVLWLLFALADFGWLPAALFSLCVLFMILRHHENIVRLCHGTEKKFYIFGNPKDKDAG